MKIGVVSDTHSRPLPEEMIAAFQSVDLIIHAGDLCSLEDYEFLAGIHKARAVCGNMDDPEVCHRFAPKEILRCGNFWVGVFHGEGSPDKVFDKVREKFKDDKVDVVVFGHSHQAFNQRIDGVLYFNPGSPTDEIFAPYCSYGILDLSGKEAKGTIIKIGGDDG